MPTETKCSAIRCYACGECMRAGAGRSVLSWQGPAAARSSGHRTWTATYDGKTTPTSRASQRNRMGKYRLQRGGPIDEHTGRQATNITIHKPRSYGSPTASRPHTN